MITQKEIAEKADVSQAVVSHVLRGVADKYKISKEKQKRVLAVARKYKYKPNILAQSLRMKKTKTIGVVLANLPYPFWSQIAWSLEQELRKNGYDILLCDSSEDEKNEQNALDLLISRKVDGLIVGLVSKDRKIFKTLRATGIPVVYIVRHFEDVDANFVHVDNREVGYKATEYLINQDLKNIYILVGWDWYQNTPMNNRILGYRQALKEYGIRFKKSNVITASRHMKVKQESSTIFTIEYQSIYRAVNRRLKKTREKTGIFAAAALQTLASLHAIRQSGLSIPEDIGFVGMDCLLTDINIAPDIPHIVQPVHEVVQASISILLENLNIAETPGQPVHSAQRIVHADFSHLK